jgi:hypothetical protein
MAEGLAGRYSQLVHDKTGWWGTYPVPLQLRVGDYVQIDRDGRMSYLGTVFDWPGWAAGLLTEPFAYEGDERFWAHATTVAIADGEAGVAFAGGSAKAAVGVNFSKQSGFVVNLAETSGSRFKSVNTARAWTLGLAKSGHWTKGAVLIVEVIQAASTTALISEESGTRFRLQASASLPVDVPGMSLTDPKLGLSVSVDSGSGYFTVNARATPLYHCVRIRRRWYGRIYGELQSAGEIDPADAFTEEPFPNAADDGDDV